MRNRPNIIFIMADDMGYGDLGCYNPDSKIPTPNMDRLAAEGMRFSDAHSSSAVCTPSRYSVITGRYCWRSALSEGVIGGYSPPLIETSRLTLASMLSAQGYATACIGKWHIGLDYQDADGRVVNREDEVDFSKPVLNGPCELGFDYAYFNAACGAHLPLAFIENDRFVDNEFLHYESPNAAIVPSGMKGKSFDVQEMDMAIARKACQWIEAQANEDQPFFLYLTPNAPHEPCVESVVPEFARGKSTAGHRGDLVWLFDWIVGQIMDTLAETGLAENTLLMVTSDNGALPGDFVYRADGQRVMCNPGRREFDYATYDHKSCGELRGYKAHIWEGGHREPLIARWPQHITPTSESDQLVCLSDLMATCAAITNSELPEDSAEDSYNMLPVLLGEADEPIRDALVHHSSFGVFAVRQGKWKVVFDCIDSGGWPTPRGSQPDADSPGQVYDLSVDSAEAHNLWHERQDVVDRLRRLLNGYKESGRSRTAWRTGQA